MENLTLKQKLEAIKAKFEAEKAEAEAKKAAQLEAFLNTEEMETEEFPAVAVS